MAKKNIVSLASTEDREKALNNALKQIAKAFGEGAVMRMDGNFRQDVQVIPTGSLALDAALGVGGLPRGRVVEIFGPESSGKTTLALHAAANAQAEGGTVAFIDAEHALDPTYAQALGVQIEELLVCQPDYGEQALSVADMLVSSGAVDLIVVDSVAALVPKAELDGDMGDSHVGLQARMMSQALRKLTGSISRSKTCLIFINQIREKIGGYGNPETTPGGRALKFYASVRLDIRRVTSIKDGDRTIGSLVKVKVAKNKVAAPFRQATFEMMFAQGISREGELIDLGTDLGVLEKAGSWYSFGKTRLGNGREQVRRFLKDNKDIADQIAEAVRRELGLKETTRVSTPEQSDTAAATSDVLAKAS